LKKKSVIYCLDYLVCQSLSIKTEHFINCEMWKLYVLVSYIFQLKNMSFTVLKFLIKTLLASLIGIKTKDLLLCIENIKWVPTTNSTKR